jgi:hypothetical protein
VETVDGKEASSLSTMFPQEKNPLTILIKKLDLKLQTVKEVKTPQVN